MAKTHGNVGHPERGEKLESEIQREICDWLATTPVLFWRSNNIPPPARPGSAFKFRALPKYVPRGLPDLIAIVDGHILCIEVKRPGMKLRPEQAEFGAKLVMAGASYHVVHSLEEVMRIPEIIRKSKFDKA